VPSCEIIGSLRHYTGGTHEIRVEGNTIGEAIEDLVTKCPSLRTLLLAEGGDHLRASIALYVNGEETADSRTCGVRLHDNDCLTIALLISGG